jgi:hypothetical protein
MACPPHGYRKLPHAAPVWELKLVGSATFSAVELAATPT